MSLKPTLIGAAIGAVAGVALHLIVEMTTGLEAPWFAVIIGLATGLGVHQANKSLAGKVSYLRGAVTAAIALVAIVGSTPLISLVARNKDVAAANKAADAAAADAGEEEASGSASADAPAAETELVRSPTAADAGTRQQMGRLAEKYPWLQFVYMAVGTFIAYEFGRGTAKAGTNPALAETVAMEPPAATDPSN
jgi:hypothetical protein